MTPEQFATMLRNTANLHEASWNSDDTRYTRSWDDCASEACPAQWARIVAVLLTPGYCDTWEWCDEILGTATGGRQMTQLFAIPCTFITEQGAEPIAGLAICSDPNMPVTFIYPNGKPYTGELIWSYNLRHFSPWAVIEVDWLQSK